MHDQAVVFLEEEFNLGEHISPICLPDSASDYTAEECFVSGYGKNGSGVYQTTLQTAQVKRLAPKALVKNTKCPGLPPGQENLSAATERSLRVKLSLQPPPPRVLGLFCWG